MSEISMLDLGWLAGLLEGEGCFSTTGASSKRGLRIGIKMTDLDVLQRAQSLIGGASLQGPYLPTEGNAGVKPYWTLTVNSQPVVAGLMMTVYPLMGERRQSRIRELLDGWRVTWSLTHHRCSKGLHPRTEMGKCRECRRSYMSEYGRTPEQVSRRREAYRVKREMASGRP